MNLPGFEFHWWMLGIAAVMICISLLLMWIKSFLQRFPKFAIALRMMVMAVLLIVAMGMLSAMTPPGSFAVCTTYPLNQCLQFVSHSNQAH
jgi:glucan phosphoethanolaminetransferase (alkaline phosphatase superfamily)